MTYSSRPFDFRRVITDFPKNYVGYALCFVTTAIDFNDLLKAWLGDLALQIRNSVSKMKNDFIRNAFATLENFRRQNDLAAIVNVQWNDRYQFDSFTDTGS